MKIRDLKYTQMLVESADQPFFCCLPSKLLEESRFEQKLEHYEEKLLDETLKPFVPSGHAFVTFDSMEALEACENYF